jgi:hypothetical protein
MDVESLTASKNENDSPKKKEAGSLCSCGGWLLLAGYGYVGPNGYLLRSRCTKCRSWHIEEKVGDRVTVTVQSVQS